MELFRFCRRSLIACIALAACASASLSCAAPLTKVNDAPSTPILAGIAEMGRLPWGFWFEEYLPLPDTCAGESPDECRFSRIFLVPDKFDYDEVNHPSFVTPAAYRWVILGYRGHLAFLAGGEPLDIRLLKRNTPADTRYEYCAASLGSESGNLACFPLVEGKAMKPDFALPEIKLDTASFLSLDRLWLLSRFDPPLTIYRRSTIKDDDAEKNDSYSSSIVFVIQEGSVSKAYSTPPAENWNLDEFLVAPNKYDRREYYKFSMIGTDDDFSNPKVCMVKLDMKSAVFESCTPLVEPKAEAVKNILK